MSSPGSTGGVTGVRLARSTASMTVLTGISRVTGLVRIVVVGAVLGDTFLGNTYQSTNSVPNLIFEIMAAGVFQAVLVPTIVRHLTSGDRRRAEEIAGSVLGTSLAVLGAVTVAAMAASPLIARGLFSGTDPAVANDQIRLGTFFLLFFLPQVAMYSAGMVATAVLNADHRFSVPAVAPAVNNVIVVAAYLGFWWSRGGAEPSLDLTGLQILLLAGGTTAGVIGFCALPVIAVRRAGFALRIRPGWREAEVRDVLRMGAWAAGFLVGNQLLLAVELVLANRVAGGVVAFQIGWTFFLLPYALFAQPVLTALFPRLSSEHVRDDRDAMAATTRRGAEMICLFTIPAAIIFVAVGPAVGRGILFGAIDPDGARQIGRVIAAFGPGVIAYGLLLFLARVSYAALDARTPTIVATGVAIVGAVVMVISGLLVGPSRQVTVLAALHSATYVVAAGIAAVLLRRSTGGPPLRLLRTLRPQILVALPITAIALPLGRAVPTETRLGALAGAVAVAAVVTIAHLTLSGLAGGPDPRTLVRKLRGG